MILLFALLGCDGPAARLPTYGDDELLAELEGYEAWAAPAGWEGLVQSCEGAHGTYVRLYANETALADLAAGRTDLSDGAMLVNASFQDTVGTPKMLGVMRKVDGYAPKGGDWYWGQLDEHGTLVLGGTIPACARCHAGATGRLWHLEAPQGGDTGCPDDVPLD